MSGDNMAGAWRALHAISENVHMNPTGLSRNQMLFKLQKIRELASTALQNMERKHQKAKAAASKEQGS